MRKLKFAVTLPLTQFLVFLSVFKLHLGLSSVDWWTALNAPALLLLDPFIRMAPIQWMPGYIAGLRPRDFIMLVGAVILWFFVGIAFDKLKSPGSDKKKNSTAHVLANLFLMMCGIRLVFLGLPVYALNNSLKEVILGAGILIWSMVFVAFSAINLLGGIRRNTPNPNIAVS